VIAAELTARPGDEIAVARRQVRLGRCALIRRARRESGL
jgi:hypothetical protein